MAKRKRNCGGLPIGQFVSAEKIRQNEDGSIDVVIRESEMPSSLASSLGVPNRKRRNSRPKAKRRNSKGKMYLTSAEAKRKGLPSTEEQIRRWNELQKKIRAEKPTRKNARNAKRKTTSPKPKRLAAFSTQAQANSEVMKRRLKGQKGITAIRKRTPSGKTRFVVVRKFVRTGAAHNPRGGVYRIDLSNVPDGARTSDYLGTTQREFGTKAEAQRVVAQFKKAKRARPQDFEPGMKAEIWREK